jgi:site-specific DNA-methyltransferase (adenine-specific)
MKAEKLHKQVTLIPGDCLRTMRAFRDNSFDSMVTDPPYNIGFMSKNWDKDSIAFQSEFWKEVLRIMKPGAHMVCFGGTRTFHRMACAIEDAGFEIRDTLMWIYGTGFPKSLDVSKTIDKAAPTTDEAVQWDGWGTALKPAWEPIILARKPLSEGTIVANVLRWGTGALNVDGCRVETSENLNGGAYAQKGARQSLAGDERAGAAMGMFQPGKTSGRNYRQLQGRWPANVVHDGSDEVMELFPQSGNGVFSQSGIRSMQDNPIYGKPNTTRNAPDNYSDEGSAARFFYCSKANKQDRAGSKHPTVKPIDLMQWLCRLITPPKGLILDPFAGSGTTGSAAVQERFRIILCEKENEHIEDIRRRFTGTELWI